VAARRWVVGLTGGIASGKSSVADSFAALGAFVIDLDVVAREVVGTGSALLGQLFERFGPSFRMPDGSLDRRALRTHVFSHPQDRRDLESLLHPAILARTGELLERAPGPYQMVVNPLLVEQQTKARYQRVLLVDCDESLQRQRLMQRDGCDQHQADAMLAAQTSRERRLAIADDVIRNDGSLQQLQSQVQRLHSLYLGLARASSTIAT
jgi:dephospho-CoA kinase